MLKKSLIIIGIALLCVVPFYNTGDTQSVPIIRKYDDSGAPIQITDHHILKQLQTIESKIDDTNQLLSFILEIKLIETAKPLMNLDSMTGYRGRSEDEWIKDAKSLVDQYR